MRDDANAARWPRVSRERPCPRCGKPDRCTLAPDGGAGRCWRDDGGKTWHDPNPDKRPARTLRTPGPGTNVKPSKVYPTLGDAVTATRLTIRGGATLYDKPWLYHDASGSPLMAVARFDRPDGKKECRPFRPSSNGWSVGDPPGPLPLYRLDALAAAPASRRVYVVEGEKCADALASIGLLATTSAHGASSAAKTDWSPLAGRPDVVVLPDRDPAGERYRAEVNSLLFRLSPPPASVRVVRLEHPRGEPTPDGFDVADWIEIRDGDEPAALAAALNVMADAAPPEARDDYAAGADADETPSDAAAARLRQRGPYLPMPLDPFPRTLREFVDASARVKDIDPALVALPVLAVASASVGNARRLRLRGDYAPPAVLWPVAVAASGDGKSPGFDAAMRPLVAAQGEAARQYAEAVAAFREAMQTWKAAGKPKGEEPDPPEPMRHLYISDATTEAVAMRLAETPRGLLCAVDEFAGLVKAFNAYKSGGGGDRESWLAFYDARAAKIDRKTAVPPTIFIPRAFVAVTGTIQPTTLRDTLTAEMVGCGFAARLLLAMPPARERAWLDDDVPAGVTNAYAELITGLRNLSHVEGESDDGPSLVRPSDAAMSRWRSWWHECERERAASADPAIRALIPKARDAAARLALVFHCCAGVERTPGVSADLLDDASMAAGIRLARWFFDEGRRVYAMLAGDAHDDVAARLVDWIDRRGGATTARDVTRHLREYPTATLATRALDALARAGVGAWHDPPPGPAGGRPTRTFMLAPHAPDAFADETPDDAAANGESSASATPAGRSHANSPTED